MSSFLVYILKSTLCLTLLYGGFRLFMQKETYFALNRAILLAIIVCATIIPLLTLPPVFQPFIHEKGIQPVQRQAMIGETSIYPAQATPDLSPETAANSTINPEEFSWIKLIRYFYWAGMAIAVLFLVHGIGSVLVLFRKAKFERADGFRLLIIDQDIPPFSFARFVVISKADHENHRQSILTHELAHIRLNHFFDLALLETAKIVHWFNPVIYWLISDMREIHEFQADENTLNTGIDAKQYQFLIIQKSVGSQRFALANSFNHCQIKNRITMMNKPKTRKARRWKVATFLPLLTLLLMAFSKTGELPSEINTLKQKVSVHQSELAKDVQSAASEIALMPPDKNYLQDNKKEKTEDALRKKEQLIQDTEKTVTGKVVDANKKPLEGASIVVSGKTIGTVADKDGVFNLNLTDTSSIVVSYVGFKSVKLTPDFEKLMTITLNPDNIGIEKVVVVAYGIQKKQESVAKGSNNKDNLDSSNKKIFTIVEQMPEFPGGSMALRKYIAQQVKYPTSAQEAGIQGNVFVDFVINSFGVVSDVKVARSVHPALDHEAIRVIYSMPKWKPGFQQGKAVDVAYSMPIEFILQYDPPVPSTK